MENAKRIPIRGKRGEGLYALVSEEDFDFLVNINWHLDGDGYAYNKKLKSMHRVIAERMGLDLAGKEIDHRDRNRLNNLRSNLRPATCLENTRNKSIHSNNKSGYPGVHFCKDFGKWRVRIGVSYSRKHIGYFKTFEEAKEARIAAERVYFGEFAPIH